MLTALAALSFSIGGYFMKLSVGLTRFRPTLLVFAFLGVGACLQTVAMRGEQMSIPYIVVLGLEAVAAFSLGLFLLDERSTVTKVAGVGLVLAGILLLRTGKALASSRIEPLVPGEQHMKSPTQSSKRSAQPSSHGKDRASCTPRSHIAYSVLLLSDDLKVKLDIVRAWIARCWRSSGTRLSASARNESQR